VAGNQTQLHATIQLKLNEQDCHGNTFPTYGDCLWARNIIICP